MNRLIQAHRLELIDLCQRYQVRSLELFGSGAKEGIKDDSEIGDLDFLVEFQIQNKPGCSDTYFDLLSSLQHLFNKPVDLIMLSAIKNPYFLQSIEENRIRLYAV